MLLKKFGFMILALTMVVTLSSCGKKQPTLEEMQQPMSPEELSRLTAQNQSVSSITNEAPQTAVTPQNKKAEQLTSVSVTVSKPTNQDIQTALKNAGFYNGTVDGKLGPKSKKAIEEFQKANGLNADGKVGSKTWSILSANLNPASVPAEPTTNKSKKNRY